MTDLGNALHQHERDAQAARFVSGPDSEAA